MVSSLLRFADNWYWALLLVAAPFLLFPSPDRAWVMLVVPVGWLLAWAATGKPLPVTPLNGSLLLLYVMIALSLYTTYDVAVSLPKVSGMVLAIGVFSVFLRMGTNPRGWWVCFGVLLASGAAIAFIGLLGTNWMVKFGAFEGLTTRFAAYITTLPGARGGLHPNELGGALLWIVPVLVTTSIVLVVHLRDFSREAGTTCIWFLLPILLILTLFVSGVTLLTQSRSSYVGSTVTLLLLLLIALPRLWRLLILICLAGLIVLGGYYVSQTGPDVIWQQWSDVQVIGNPGFSPRVMEGRVEVWACALLGIRDYPISGMGMNTFRGVAHVLYPEYSHVLGRDIAHAHNEFLQAGLDLGVPGMIAFVALYIGALGMLVEIWKRSFRVPPGAPAPRGFAPPSVGPLARALALGLGGGLLAHAIYGMTDAVALGAKPGILFWMLLGLICGLHAQSERFSADDV